MVLGSKTYRSIALTMAALMFFTSMSFAVDMHYCGGTLKSFKLFSKAKSCHEIKAKKVCPNHAQITQNTSKETLERNCCQNKTTFVQADIEQVNSNLQSIDLQNITLLSIANFPYSKSLKKTTPTLAYYKPPLIKRDLPILVQAFLL